MTILGFVVLQRNEYLRKSYLCISLFFCAVAVAVCGLLGYFDRSVVRESEAEIDATGDTISALQAAKMRLKSRKVAKLAAQQE